jgi:hypothetical protein
MLGLEGKLAQTPYTLLFRDEKLRQSQGSREIWDVYYPWANSPKRRREARCEWINQYE